MALTRWRGATWRIYSFDILGAGAGSLGVVALLFVVLPQTALSASAPWAAPRRRSPGSSAATGGAGLRCCRSRRWPGGLAIALMAGLWALPADWVAPAMSPYKELPQALRIPGARVFEQMSSPLGLVRVVESPPVLLRHVPGLSQAATVEPPPQLGGFVDG